MRGFAKACYEADPRMTWDSWKRTINRALDEDAGKPYTPSQPTAELWAQLLGKPADYFVRPQARTSMAEEIARLRQQYRDALRRIAELEAADRHG